MPWRKLFFRRVEEDFNEESILVTRPMQREVLLCKYLFKDMLTRCKKLNGILISFIINPVAVFSNPGTQPITIFTGAN